jgi:Fe-S cluster biogenesis protein NfuA
MGTGTSEDDASIEQALQTLRDVLAGDGYRLEWAKETASALVVRVVAGDGACEECLVPEAVMQAILTDALAGTPWSVARVELPAAAR